MFPRLVLAALAALAVPVPARAAEVTVTSTIQAAVDSAADGDTIRIPARTYSETVTTAKQLTLAAERGAVLVNPAGADRPTLAFTGTGGDTVTDLVVVSTVGDAVQAGGGTTLVQRSRLITLARGAAALSTTTASAEGAKAITLDSTVLSGPIALSAAYDAAPATLLGGAIAVSARHVTAIGNVVADASGATASDGIAITFTDSIVRGASVAVPGTSSAATVDTATRNDVRPTAADAAALFVAPAAFDYHLRADAPVIGRGQASGGESPTDIDGDERGATTDLGADEFANRAPTAALAAPGRAVRQNIPTTFDASRSADPESRSGGGIATYRWDFGDGTTTETSTPTVTHAYAEKRPYSATVTVTDRQGGTSGPSAPVAFAVIDGTRPTVTIGGPAARQRIALYDQRGRRRRVTFFGGAQDDQAMGRVYLALRAVAVSNGRCRWFDGRRRLVVRSCAAPPLLTPAFLNGGWRFALPTRARLPRGPYALVAVAVDASGLPSETRAVSFRFR